MSSSSLEPSSVAIEHGGQEPCLPVDFPVHEPIRGELLGLERLGGRARVLARACELAPRRHVSSPLLARFMDNRRVLLNARRAILGSGRQQIHGIDADWLADNFHIIDDVLREVRLDLPRGYDAILPKLASPPVAGYPRVYALGLTLVAHTDSELDEPRIDRFVQAFQEVASLSISELWALPTMCRVVLIENLRRLAEQMLWGWSERLRAERWLQDFLPRGEPHGRIPRDRRSEGRFPPLGELSDPFVVRLIHLLRDLGVESLEVMNWLEGELARGGKDPDQVLAREGHRQAANQVTIGNAVISLRLLSTVDWNAFFERTSLVQQILRQDPAGAYPLQDFITSDRYRKIVEKIARGSNADETDVARRAIALANAGMSQGQAKGHVGYYLLGEGVRALKDMFHYRTAAGERLLEAILEHPSAVYFGSLFSLLIIFFLLVCRGTLGDARTVGWYWMSLILLVALLPLSELTVGLVNHLLTLLLPPRVLPKLEFKEAIPEEFSTFVVVPAMLSRPGSAETLCDRLETHYLANPTPGVRFALLTDFADATREEMPDDRSFVDDALRRVQELNRRYAGNGSDLFYIFHRRRLWNSAQGCWMGWERKRGKLSEFNRMLRGDRNTTYAFRSADPASLPPTRFVITLDADTQMPRDTVGRLIGTLAHPLNQPQFDAQTGRVVAGYGVLQPRVSFHLTAATHSRFAALLAASGGIDPYSTAASDAYMDLFGLGSFTGKGIYDLEAFESATGSVFPENQILSHDLIEGNYARCGLLSDTELFDDFPARYLAYARREHRWIRGDWQLLPWLGSRVPAPEGTRQNPLRTLERWKLFDNLRRSLVPPALLVMLTLGWTVLPGAPWLWSSIALAVLALPFLKWLIGATAGCIRAWSLVGFSSWRASIPSMGGQVILSLVLLADQAGLSCDAIARTIWRLLVTRRKLLEWETAAAAEQRLGSSLKDFARSMWIASALALAIALAVAVFRPVALWAAAPFLAAWLLSPLVAFWVSRPRNRAEFTLTEDERIALRRLARRTWRFFETFVGDLDHWLPPDNYQEEPDGRVAHRTSPTNQGLLLLSYLAAHDLGYVSLNTLADRLERTFDSLEKLDKHWGHFYNWYDTRTLLPLSPLYISTVDSGNFLACLVALKQGLKEKFRQPALGSFVAAGLADTLRQINERHQTKVLPIEKLLLEQPAGLQAWDGWLERLEHEARLLVEELHSTIMDEEDDDSGRWAESFRSQVSDCRADLA
ncbi:MAG: GH36-type glycosyl hydrolase domain-containing protein, partial [Isosphaeraceae bacterium]